MISWGRPLYLATGTLLLVFAVLGGLSSLFVSWVGQRSIYPDEWQPTVLPQGIATEALVERVKAHSLMQSNLASVKKADNVNKKQNASITGIQLPGGGRLLGLVFQGDKGMALVQATDSNEVGEYRVGDLLPGGQQVQAVEEGTIRLSIAGNEQSISLYQLPN